MESNTHTGDNNMTHETDTPCCLSAASIPSPRHGGAHDRGRTDAWYQRPRTPHYFQGATYSTPRVSEAEMTVDEVAIYHRGYDEVADSGLRRFFLYFV